VQECIPICCGVTVAIGVDNGEEVRWKQSKYLIAIVVLDIHSES